MIIRDKIDKGNLFLVEQDLPTTTFYEIYRNNQKVFQGRDFNEAITEWTIIIKMYVK